MVSKIKLFHPIQIKIHININFTQKQLTLYFLLLYKVVHGFIEKVLCKQLSCGAELI